MRADAAEADRRQEVREAARAWERAGAIDEATRRRIEAAYPDDRNRLGPVFRVLVFCFSLVILQSTLGIAALLFVGAGEKGAAILYFACGLGLVALTEVQTGGLRRRQGGTEAATALLAAGLILGTSLWLFSQVARPSDDFMINMALVLAVGVLGAAGYRWGYALFTGLAVVAAFVLLGRFPYGRLLWAVAALAVGPLALRASDSAELAPSHRRSCAAVTFVALVALYVALHLMSWDVGLVEMLTGHFDAGFFGPPRHHRAFFMAATALVPILTLAWGIAVRRRLLINVALAGLVSSIVTLRAYVHVAPLFVVLLVGGGAAIVLALLLRRYLDSGPGRERGGFTAEPVFTDPEGRSALEVAASVASLAPAPRPVPVPEPAPIPQPGFQGGGGRSGGGGASGSF